MAKRVRGTFSPEQIQAALRQGDSPIVFMAKGAFAAGNLIQTDADGNAVDSGGTAPRLVGVPASATATGAPGWIAWDSGFLYVCTATDTWKRVAIASW